MFFFLSRFASTCCTSSPALLTNAPMAGTWQAGESEREENKSNYARGEREKTNQVR